MTNSDTRQRFEKFQNRDSVKETMEMFTNVIANMYEADQKHTIEDPLEHILKELGITPPRKA
jgi:hypothetical protein